MTPNINFESLSYNPFRIHESSVNSEHEQTLTFTKILLLLRHITIALMISEKLSVFLKRFLFRFTFKY